MIGTREHQSELREQRRLEEIRWLEELWEATPVYERKVRPAWRWSVAPILIIAWPVFLGTLLTLPPAPQAGVSPPLWVEFFGVGMFLALTATLVGIAHARLGFAASGFAGAFGTALAVGCFAGGHTGFWPSYQLAGFAALVGLSAAGWVRAGRLSE